jgi:hypothetical protein
MKKSFDLNIDTSDYLGGLKATLNDLRQSWQQDWVGLPAVLQACQQALGVCRLHAGQDLRIQAVNLLALTIAEHMERQKGQQPAYHNNLHTADVLVSVTVLIVVQMQLQPMTAVDKLWLADVLAAAAGHDYAHPGGINQFPADIETLSVKRIKAEVDSSVLNSVDHDDLTRVFQLILNTEYLLVPANHFAVAQTDFCWGLPWCSVLLNEADILASATAEFGPDLGQLLLHEFVTSSVKGSHTLEPKSFQRQFLKFIQFSTPAAIALGMPEQVQLRLNS